MVDHCHGYGNNVIIRHISLFEMETNQEQKENDMNGIKDDSNYAISNTTNMEERNDDDGIIYRSIGEDLRK